MCNVHTCKYGSNIDNLFSLFERSATTFPFNNALGYRQINDGKLNSEFEWETYGRVHEKILNIGSGLNTLNLPQKSCFGIYTANRVEYQVITLACFSQALTCVPIYDTFGEHIVNYVCNHAEICVMFAEHSKMQAVINNLKFCPTLKYH